MTVVDRSSLLIPTFAALTLATCTNQAPAANYVWTGSGGNNNWQNNGNWSGGSGYPDSLSDSVIFPVVNINHEEVDLSGSTRTVYVMTFNLTSTASYLFRSSSSGGNLRNFGSLTSTNAQPVVFDSSMTYTQADAGNPLNSTWNLDSDPQYMVFNGNLAGSSYSNITLHGGVTLNQANPYSGTFTVAGDGLLKLGHYNGMLNAAVVLNANDGLKFDTNSINVNLGSLAGNASGLFDMGGHTLTVGSLNTDTTYAGTLTSTATAGVGAAMTKTGSGTMTLSGPISIYQLGSTAGSIVLDGNTVDLADTTGIDLNGGDMSITNGAQVTLSGTDGTAAVNSQTLTIDGGQLFAGRITSNTDGTVDLADLTGGQALTIGMANGQSVSSTFAGILTGAGSFDKVGTGTWTLTSANTFSGSAVINAGSVVLDDVNALQNATVQLNVDNGLDINSLDAKLGGLSGSGALDIGSQAVKVGSNGANTTYAGVFSGTDTSQLLKRGSGTLTLTGGTDATPSTLGSIQSNNGKVVVDNGVIQLGGGESFIDNGTLTITGANAKLSGIDLEAAHNASKIGTIVIQDQATVQLSGTLYAGYQGSGTLKVNSGGHLTADTLGVATNALNTAIYSNAKINDAGTTVSVNHLDIGSHVSGTHGEVTVSSDADVQVAADTTLNHNLDRLTINGGALATDTLVNASSGTPEISISDPTGGTALTIGTNDGSSTWDGLIQDADGGPGSILKTGAGSLTLSAANTYTGSTLIEGGSVVISADDNLGAGGTVNLGGGTLVTNNTFSLNRDITLTDLQSTSSTIQVNGTTRTVTLNGSLSGAAGLTLNKISAGSLRLTQANPFAGNLQISNGLVILANADALQNATVSINADDGLDITTNAIDANLGALAGSGNFDIGSQKLTVGSNNTDTAYTGVMTGDSSSTFTKSGTGTLTLTGGTSASPSTLGRLFLGSGRLSVDNAAVQLTGGSYSYIQDATLTLSGANAQLSGGRLEVGEFSGETGNLIVENQANLDLSGDLVIGLGGIGNLTAQSGAQMAASHLYVSGESGVASSVLFTGADTTGAFDQLYIGPQVIGGPGAVTIADGADVQVASGTVLHGASNTLTVNGGSFSTGTLSKVSGGVPVISLSDPTGGTAMTIGTNDGDSTWGGLIQDAAGGPGSIRKTGTGTLTLSAANTFSGTASIDAGQIVLSNADALQNATVSINVDDGLDVTTNTIDANLGALAGSGDLNIGSQALTVGSNGASTTYAGDLTGSGSLNKAGAGTLDATGSLTMNQLLASAGTLNLDGATVGLIPDVFNALYVRQGAQVNIENAAQVTIGGGAEANPRIVLTDDGSSLSISDAGTLVQTAYFDVGPSGNGTATATIQNDAQLNVTGRFSVGDLGANNDSDGLVNITTGATVNADSTVLFDTGTLNIDGGSLVTNTLVQADGTGQTLKISDPSGGAALTVGTGDGSSTYAGVIQDAAGGAGSIDKVGAGTLTLTNANTYTGDTIIDGGTLSIQNAYLSDSADVWLNASALFDLNFSGTDLINALYVGGLSKVTGTYGAIGSGADHELSLFTGAGMLQVTAYPGIPGDLNSDGYVGLDDLQLILDHWNQNVTTGDPLQGDVSGPGGVPDGYVGLDDLQPVLDHWNEGTLPVPGGTNVPEPASWLLLGALALSCGRAVRRS